VGSPDAILGALTAAVPLRRRFADRLNARCMVELGLAPEGTADFIACERHGRGLPALTCAHLEAEGRPQEAVVLYGVDPELRRILLADGHRLRVYVPYGRDWYPYSTRRLRENPEVATHVLKGMFGAR